MHCNWGLTWQLQERWDRAIEEFEIAISQKSDQSPPILIWAVLLQLRSVLTKHVMLFAGV